MTGKKPFAQDFIPLKESKSSIGQANYYPNLVIVPDTFHI
jgi:hypothetical protein